MCGGIYFNWKCLLTDISFFFLSFIGIFLAGALFIIFSPAIIITMAFAFFCLLTDTMIKFACKEDTLLNSIFFGITMSLVGIMISPMPLLLLQMELEFFGKLGKGEGIIFQFKEYDSLFIAQIIFAAMVLFWLWAILCRIFKKD